jgi:serine/threonine-protein kinase
VQPGELDVPAIGSLLAGKYRIEAVLGAGGMGVVLAATHIYLQQKIAIKLMHASTARRPIAVERFLREARVAMKLRGEHAVRILDVGLLPTGLPFIVMEHLTGRDFGAVLEADGSLGLPRAVDYLLQACEAIAEAHALGVVHRDLKPSNLFLTTRVDGSPWVKVLDFGIVKVGDAVLRSDPLEATVPSSTLPSAPRLDLAQTLDQHDGSGFAGENRTATRAVLGSPRFTAPEQLRSPRDVDARADIWALGILLYTLLAGVPPFDGDSFDELKAAVEERQIPPLTGVPARLIAALERALAKSPEARYASVADFAEAIAPFGSSAAGASVECIQRVVQTVKGAPLPLPAALPPTRARRLRVRAAAYGAACVLALAALHVARGCERPKSAARPSMPSAALGGLPLSPASSAYAAAMQAWGDGSSHIAETGAERAIELDPNHAAAALHVVLWGSLARWSLIGTIPRDAAGFARAVQLRSSADEYEGALIDAFAPRARPIDDPAEVERRLEAMTVRFPDRGEPWYWLALSRSDEGKSAEADLAARRAAEIEPWMQPSVLALRAWISRASADPSNALLEQCLALAPGAADCLGQRSRLRGLAGQCDAMVSDVHAWVIADGSDAHAYQSLADGLFASGAPIEGVFEALTAMEEREIPFERAWLPKTFRAEVAIGAGSFSDAQRMSRELEQELGPSPTMGARFGVTGMLIAASTEAGDVAAVRDAATGFLKRAQAWTPTSPSDEVMAAPMLVAARRTGALSREEFLQQRARLVAAAESKRAEITTDERVKVWLYLYGYGCDTKEDAVESLAAMPRYVPPVEAESMQSVRAAIIGYVYARAEEPAKAIPYLQHAAQTCFVLNDTFDAIYSRAVLGHALLATGQRDEALRHYESVLARWGHATPRSVTADQIRAKLAELEADATPGR